MRAPSHQTAAVSTLAPYGTRSIRLYRCAVRIVRCAGRLCGNPCNWQTPTACENSLPYGIGGNRAVRAFRAEDILFSNGRIFVPLKWFSTRLSCGTFRTFARQRRPDVGPYGNRCIWRTLSPKIAAARQEPPAYGTFRTKHLRAAL